MRGSMLLYLLTISLWLMLAALMAEWLLVRLRRPARWAWVGALLLVAALPFAPRSPAEPPVAPPQLESATSRLADLPDLGESVVVEPPMRDRLAALEVPASLLIAASVVTLALLLVGWALLVWRSRRWRAATLQQTPVLLAPATGPAVVGFLRPRIVVPQWAFALPAEQQRMLLAHEQSHLDARDPLLLLLSALVVVAMPWNPLLWFGLHRLRGAIEIDCDARVLAGGEPADGYARCLVDSVTLAAGGPAPMVGALSLSSSILERRVHLMLHPRRAFKVVSVVAALAGIGLVTSAFRVTPPAPAPDAVRWSKAIQALEARPYKQAEGYYERLLNGKIGNTETLYGVFYENWSIRDPKAKGC